MFYPDLGQECQVDSGPYVRAVGWLSHGYAFPTGNVSREFLDSLRRHIRTAWQPVVMMGPHICEFCPRSSDGRYNGGSLNLWIPADGVVFVAPELILHYIEAHGYRPPDGFINAVVACPEQNSEAYREQMRQFPARWVKYLADGVA